MTYFVVLTLVVVVAYFWMTYNGAKHPKGLSAAAVAEREAEWMHPFVLYFVASEMHFVRDGKISDRVHGLVVGNVSRSIEMSLLGSLQNYLPFAYGKEGSAHQLRSVVSAIQIFLRAELQTINSPVAVKQLIRRMHARDTGTKITEDELEKQFTRMSADARGNDEIRSALRNLLLKDSVENLFAVRHKKPIAEYVADVLAYQERAIAAQAG